MRHGRRDKLHRAPAPERVQPCAVGGSALATLFDFPFQDRHKLTYWSDLVTTDTKDPEAGVTPDERRAELLNCLEYFTNLWNQRVNKPRSNDIDLISMLAHDESTRHMQPMEFLGTLLLLIVGGNDTTRNSISAGVLALNRFPNEYQKLRDRADEFIIDRAKARHHVAFGFGIHRCMGNRLAEMQLKLLWEEIMKRFRFVEVVGPDVRIRSNFVRGIKALPVVVHPL